VPIATAAAAWMTWRALGSRAEVLPFAGAILLFVLSYLGIAISLFPMIVPYHFTLSEAASSDRTQAFLLVGTLVLLPVILMYSGWSYWVFRGKVRADTGYHWSERGLQFQSRAATEAKPTSYRQSRSCDRIEVTPLLSRSYLLIIGQKVAGWARKKRPTPNSRK
jgi:hypothetical protein